MEKSLRRGHAVPTVHTQSRLSNCKCGPVELVVVVDVVAPMVHVIPNPELKDLNIITEPQGTGLILLSEN